MKKTRSLLLAGATAALAAVIAIGGSLAYYTDRDAATNVFTVGNVDIELNEKFEQGAELVPGVDIQKEATITNTGKNDAWVWLTVLLPEEMGPYTAPDNMSASNNVVHWNYPKESADNITVDFNSTPVEVDTDGDGVTESYYQTNMLWKQVLEAGDTTGVMLNKVYMDTRVDIDPDGNMHWVVDGVATDLNWNVNEMGNPKILVAAYAIQAQEFDSVEAAYAAYGKQWGANGGVEYPTAYAEVASEAELKAALADAAAGEDLYIKLTADIEWTTEGTHGAKNVTSAANVVIDGQNEYTMTATGSGVTPIGDDEATFTFKNMTIADKSVSYAESSWEFSYLEMGGKALNCVNVDFTDPIMVSSETATFTDCSFVGYEDSTNSIKMNGVWMYSGDATFTNCTFTGTRGMKICDMYTGGEVGTVVIDGCTFDSLSEKPGVAIDDCDTKDMNITIKNSTFINCQPGDQGLYIYETDNTVPTVENNKVENYTSVVEIGTKDELVAFAQRVNGGDGMSKILVKLTDNIDLAGMEWTPIGQTGTSYGATTYFQGIFDGQGYTISNMTISRTNEGEHYAAGFFGFIDAADATIKDVNFDKATVNGHHWTAVVAGYLTGTVDNCNVTNSIVNCTHANDNACGDKAGAVVGYVNSGLVKNCSVSDTTVAAGRDGGQVVGAAKTTQVSNCTVTNVAVSATAGCTGANINNAVIGRVL